MLNKICIIGGPGSGKSTLANNLSEILNLQAIHIDELYENKDWKFDDRKKIEKKLLDKINNTDKWIIDGTYTETLEKRLNKCDLMIFLDFSTLKLLKGVVKRRLQNMNISIKNLGWNERMSMKFIKYVLFFNKKKRLKINTIIKDNKKCIVLKNRKEVELFKKYLKTTQYLKI
jgi:adenylate kinase family enzyme